MTIMAVGQDEALLSDDPVTRIVARATASRWVSGFQEWAQSELKRGENPANIIIAMMRVNVMTHSSVAANFMSPTGYQDCADGYKQVIDGMYVRHAQECAKALAAGGHR